jgi:hypothetical protein
MLMINQQAIPFATTQSKLITSYYIKTSRIPKIVLLRIIKFQKGSNTIISFILITTANTNR